MDQKETQTDADRKLLADVRRRLERKTFIQDVTEPLTGQVDRRRLAQRINNVENAVSDLAEVVEHLESRAS